MWGDAIFGNDGCIYDPLLETKISQLPAGIFNPLACTLEIVIS